MKKIVVFAAAVAFTACKKDSSASLSCDSSLSFSGTVQPVLVSKCATSGCHDGSRMTSMATYTNAKNEAQSIKTSVENGSMPRGSSLSSAEKTAILCWIQNGTPNN